MPERLHNTVLFVKTNATQIGMTGGFGAWMTKFMETSTPIIQYIGLCLGCAVAFLTVMIRFKDLIKNRSKKRNEDKKPME